MLPSGWEARVDGAKYDTCGEDGYNKSSELLFDCQLDLFPVEMSQHQRCLKGRKLKYNVFGLGDDSA